MWSMTGFGKSNGIFEGKKRSIEVRSLNGKGLDLSMRLPLAFRELEPEFRLKVSETLERGKIDVSLHLEEGETTPPGSIDFEIASNYLNEIKSFSTGTSLSMEALLPTLVTLPGVVKHKIAEFTPEEKEFVIHLLDEALTQTQEFRQKEGKNLHMDLLDSLGKIQGHLLAIEPFEKERILMARNRLEGAIKELKTIEVDKTRIEQELLFYIDKLDVSEEKTRLNSHINYFKETLNVPVSNGKKLGFIVQEMGREINTLGSKSNHAEMQRLVVEMKNLLEKIKEQVQNVL